MPTTTAIPPANLPAILQLLGKLKPIVEKRFKAKLLGVFGSYARQEQRPDSDLDILVHFGPGATLFDMVELEYFLREELGIQPDIVSDGNLKPRLKPNILQELIAI